MTDCSILLHHINVDRGCASPLAATDSLCVRLEQKHHIYIQGEECASPLFDSDLIKPYLNVSLQKYSHL